jgi:hypothetical protein
VGSTPSSGTNPFGWKRLLDLERKMPRAKSPQEKSLEQSLNRFNMSLLDMAPMAFCPSLSGAAVS